MTFEKFCQRLRWIRHNLTLFFWVTQPAPVTVAC
jgi:hypothetical protein